MPYRAVLTCLILLIGFGHTFATVYHVDGSMAGNAGTGITWSTAKRDIQDAIMATQAGDTIWVKSGTYLPTRDPSGNASPVDPRDKTFLLKDSVKIFGGFSGAEKVFSQRNAAINPTKLSGNIGHATDSTDNCYHVVLMVSVSAATILDGFSITGGSAWGSGMITVGTTNIGRAGGSGVVCASSSAAMLRKLVIHNNSTSGGGGGMAIISSSPTLDSVVIRNNSATVNGEGGGIHNSYGATPRLNNVMVSENIARFGGGIYNYISSAILDHVIINRNYGRTMGGGVYNYVCSPSFTNVVISDDTSTDGGGMYNMSSGPTLSNVVFNGNRSVHGGGMVNDNGSTSVLTNVDFCSNTAVFTGGGLYNTYSMPLLTNTVFYGNVANASNDMYNDFSSYLNSGSTNNASDVGGASQVNNGNHFLSLSGISPAGIFKQFLSPAGADSIWITGDDGLRLIGCSPLTNAGATTSTPVPTDILGNSRMGAYDIGAYEYPDVYPFPVPIVRNGDTLSTDSFSGYQWYFNNVAIPGAVNRYYIPAQNGSYTVAALDTNQCSVSSQAYVLQGLGVYPNSTAPYSVTVYPNPGKGIIKIAAAMPVNVIVENVQGHVVFRRLDAAEIDVSRFADGMYLIFVNGKADGRLLRSIKFVKAD